MATYVIEYDGLKLTVEATWNPETCLVDVKITCDEGHANINAFYWSDGDDNADFGGFKGKDSNLNMNGTDVDWDGALKLSSPGLGKTPPDSYLTEGQCTTFSLPKGVTLDDLATIGIRATSTSTAEGSIKGVAEPECPPDYPPPDFPDYGKDYSNIVFYLDKDGVLGVDENSDVVKIKVDFGPDADILDLNDNDAVWDWLVDNYLDGSPNAYTLLGYTVHAGNAYIDENGVVQQATGNNGGPGSNPLHSGEGPNFFIYIDDGDDTPDYTDATKAAGPTANADLLALGVTDAVLAANYDAQFVFDGTLVS